MFEIIKKDGRTHARLGVLKTPHGVIQTPSYVFVGTYGKFRHLTPKDIKKTKSQVVIANTFHLRNEITKHKLQNTNKSQIQKHQTQTFLLSKLGTKMPTMTDSGGFQVLSLAFGDKNKVGKFMADSAKIDATYKRSKIKVTDKGVHFNFKGRQLFLGPELSMKLQSRIGADIIFAFDHITSPLDDFKYNKKALELTEKWARICLKEHTKNQKDRKNKQMLFGIVQGGIYRRLREKSARQIGSLPFDGFGIGGAYTKKQIAKILKWVIPYLPEEKPRHLLGVGKVADIFEAIENGVDMFDCVIPTREARHGRLYTKRGTMQIQRGIYADDKRPIEVGCKCPTCSKKVSLAKIRALIKSPDAKLNAVGQRWCLMHNMWFFNNLLERIRESIKNERFSEFKRSYLKRFLNPS